MRNKVSDICAYVSTAFIILSVLLVIMSWIVSAVDTDANIRSLLGGEGIRWMFGSFVDNVLSPLLIWLILIGMAMGICRDSGLAKILASRETLSDYDKMAFSIVVLIAFSMVVILLLLTCLPHAVLLSAMGTIWGGRAVVGFVPYLALIVVVCSLAYGCITGAFRSFQGVYRSLYGGMASFSPILVSYMCMSEFFNMLAWVMNI